MLPRFLSDDTNETKAFTRDCANEALFLTIVADCVARRCYPAADG